MKLAIIDSGGANIASVQHALQRLGAAATITADRQVIASADRVILPGVGAAGVGTDDMHTDFAGGIAAENRAVLAEYNLRSAARSGNRRRHTRRAATGD